jgi:hypothetical protein
VTVSFGVGEGSNMSMGADRALEVVVSAYLLAYCPQRREGEGT